MQRILKNKESYIYQIHLLTCRKIVMLSFPSLPSQVSNAWQAFSMSRKHVIGSLLMAKIISPCSNRFSAFDPARQPLTRKTWRLIGSFLTRSYRKQPSILITNAMTIKYAHTQFFPSCLVDILARTHMRRNIAKGYIGIIQPKRAGRKIHTKIPTEDANITIEIWGGKRKNY